MVADSMRPAYSLSATLLSGDIGTLCILGSQGSVISIILRQCFIDGMKVDETSLTHTMCQHCHSKDW